MPITGMYDLMRRTVRRRIGQSIAVICGLPLFIYLVLALAESGSISPPCDRQSLKWFGCILDKHDSLAGGLIGAAVTLVAAWVAWAAVQRQISAEQARRMADRLEVEKILADQLTYHAEGMAAAWRLLVAIPEGADSKATWPTREATAYMAARLTRPEQMANYRAMVGILGWQRRIQYNALILALEGLTAYGDPDAITDTDEVLGVIRNLADEFEYCLPATGKYFEGLWRRSPKAMSFADYINRIASWGER